MVRIRLSSFARFAPLGLTLALVLAGCSGSSPQQQTAGASPAGATASTPSAPSPHSTLTPDERKAAAAVYAGKTLRIIVGSGAGGGFDTTARLVSRHLAKHVPGTPLVIVENMPGAGGLLAANHMFFAAPKDGLVLGIFHEGQVLNQLIGADGVQFDLRKFNWLGSSYVDPNVCVVRTDAWPGTFKDMIGSPKPVIIGGTGPGSNTYDVPRVIAEATGANLKVVAGYTTTNDARIGVERGELSGMCLGWESVKATVNQWLTSNYARVVVQNGVTKHKDLPDVPLALEFGKDDESRNLLRLVASPAGMAKAFALPPGVEESRVKVMRDALFATYQDPDFLAEAKVMQLTFEPGTSDQIQTILADALATPADIAAKYKLMIKP